MSGCQILVFPIARRVKFIAKTARYMSELAPATAEKQLRHALDVQRATMQKRGIRQELIQHEISSAENAIRAACRRREVA